jgi:hypothetical protein
VEYRLSNILLCMSLATLVIPASAEETAWRTSWDSTLYGYANDQALRSDSALNPGNAIARLPERSLVAEARFNFKAENERVRLTMRPIFLVQDDLNLFGSQQKNEAYLSQWQARFNVAESWTVAGGRDVLNWGAAQFRSPSNPFYFNNGRSNPMSELSGLDVVRLTWSPDVQHSLYVARLYGSGHGHADPDPWRDSWLVKADVRGDGRTGGVALAKQPGQAIFVGAHGQQAIGDEWLLYGEMGSSTHMNALQSPVDKTQPLVVAGESSRRTNGLVGATYTADSGQSFTVEYLHYDFGYDSNESAAYFSRAANAATTFYSPTSMQALSLALRAAPQLLGRDYVHMVWQSNIMESNGYWRLMATHNITDGSNELSGYGEHTLDPRITAFVLAQATTGGSHREFSSLSNGLFMLGVKFALH